jgi:soluble epoxide hydrolase/lipid-phosphate phosphatase
MPDTKIVPIDPISDPRVTHEYSTLNGQKYHYFLGVPKGGKFKTTVFLIHGWPDLAIGWRYQIPYLIELGCRVVAPDMMGYGGTGAPPTPPNSLQLYGYKRASDDLAELARQLGSSRIVIGGHDWGGMIAWRFAQFYPSLVSHLFVVCTPYNVPHKEYISIEDLVKGPMPQFGYQLHLASGEIEKKVTTKEDMSAFIRGVYGARTPRKEVVFSPTKGILLNKLHELGPTWVMSDKVGLNAAAGTCICSCNRSNANSSPGAGLLCHDVREEWASRSLYVHLVRLKFPCD